ncbi:TetR/AcrR family transcriptional regulator [Actinoplanes derwentensis]|uniref:DNA-binding transcriptional regulator, AcrR family n=1 Tax=Actinoplanes derwentensis TaxID=113562 RepID=A0A1H1QTC8_9ACTN|nr:TetR/AcrR family transcriptional regulator [Actinoplanes derwentensis]GID89339.1 TetR family transcriptional regulator [Actinoplanes derwentensis]SDS26573.1 DNA-binding transcriptional regulator, AcrR family [Actinoplanes derwentensis]
MGLRDRLVRVGGELLDRDGPSAVTLREIARRAGVSHGAPRRYFPTHMELLSAIARDGFGELAGRAAAALDGAPDDPYQRIALLSRTYLDFAADRPGRYDLLFRHDLLQSGHLGLRDTSLPLFRQLSELVDQARPGSTTPPDIVAGAIWASLHGIAHLWQRQSLPLATGTTDPQPLLDAVLTAHLGRPT